MEETQTVLLPNSNPGPSLPTELKIGNPLGNKNSAANNLKTQKTMQIANSGEEVDLEFLTLADLLDFGQD